MFKFKDTENEVVCLMMFPLSLTREAKTWLDELNEGTIETWDEHQTAFISRFFPPALFNRLLGEIRDFSQHENESLTDAWLRIKEMLRNFHGHNLSKGNIIKIFYHGLNEITQEGLNAIASGNCNFDIDKIMARMDAMTIKMDAHYKELQSHTKQTTLDLDDDDIHMSHEEEAKFMQTFCEIPNYDKFLKELISKKPKFEQISAAFLTDESFVILQNKVPPKLRDPESFLIPCNFNKTFSCNALADLGASTNLMSYSLYAKLSLETLKPIKMSVRLANRSFQYHVGIAKNMLVEVGKFTFPADFVILEIEEDSKVPLILGRPFLHTADAEKCHFMVKEGIVLGHKVSGAGLEVDKAKINVILKLPPPTNIKGNGDFYFEVEDEETKLIKETPCELFKDNQKKKLYKNNEAKMTIYNALSRKEYERVFMCKTAKELWHTLIITHQGNSQVKNCRIDLLSQEYEKFSISNEETIDSGFTRFSAIITSLRFLDPDYSSKNHVRRFLRALPLKLKVMEMILASDGVASKPIKEKVMPIALKANVTRGQTSNDSVCQDGSYEDEDKDKDEEKEFNSIVRNLWKLFKKGNRFNRENRFGNGGDRRSCKRRSLVELRVIAKMVIKWRRTQHVSWLSVRNRNLSWVCVCFVRERGFKAFPAIDDLQCAFGSQSQPFKLLESRGALLFLGPGCSGGGGSCLSSGFEWCCCGKRGGKRGKSLGGKIVNSAQCTVIIFLECTQMDPESYTHYFMNCPCASQLPSIGIIAPSLYTLMKLQIQSL
nr:reverse transcriptase domain-containing protein [Tanacetum cinerariifolium]